MNTLNITQIKTEVKTITDWAIPQINGQLLITEGPRYGFVPDATVSHLAGYLKTQHGNNPAVCGEALRGYEIDLGNGLAVGVTRKRGGLRRGNWLAFCRVKPQPITETENGFTSGPDWFEDCDTCGQPIEESIPCPTCEPAPGPMMTEAEVLQRQTQWEAANPADDYGI